MRTLSLQKCGKRQMDRQLIEAYDMPFENLTILECGSYSSGEETKRFRANNTCYYMDALEQHIREFKQTEKDVQPERVFHSALSDSDGMVEFTVAEGLTGNSSLEHSPEHIENLKANNVALRTITVPCISYETLQRDIIKSVIDVLILDIEGGEVNVLRSWKQLPHNRLPKILCIEAGYNWPVRKKLLLELGYVIDFYSFNNVVLHHSSFDVKLNHTFIRNVNLQNPKFVYNGVLIFENDCIYN